MKFKRFLWGCLLLILASSGAKGDTLGGGPFVVTFQPADRSCAEETLVWLEAARVEFNGILPLGQDPVHVRIAASMNEFLGLSGAYAHVGVNGVTRARENLIALKSPRLRSIGDDYRGTVRHELLHVLLHRNTNTENLPRWLNEGICMMLSNELRWESSLQLARMHLSGQVIPLAALDQAFAMPGSDHQFSNAYAQALSMTRHLRNEVGDARFWALVGAMKDKSFSQAMIDQTGLTAQAFWDDYLGSLWGLTVISVLRTGSFWGCLSILSIITFFIRRSRNRVIVRRWDSTEATPDEEEPFNWDSVLADGDEWKQ